VLQVFRTRPRRRARLSIERAELVLPLQHTAGRQKRTQQRVITEHLVLFAIYHYIYLLLRLIPDCPKREDTLHLGTRVCAVFSLHILVKPAFKMRAFLGRIVELDR